MTKRPLPLLVLLYLLGSCAPAPAASTQTPTAPTLAILTSTPIATPKPIMASTFTDEPPPTQDLPADRMALSDFADVDLSTLPVVDNDGLLALCADVVENSPLPDPNSVDPVQFIVQGDGSSVAMAGITGDNFIPVYVVLDENGNANVLSAVIVGGDDGANHLECVRTVHAVEDAVAQRYIRSIAWGTQTLSINLVLKDESGYAPWEEILASSPDAEDVAEWIIENDDLEPLLATLISPH